MKTNKDKLNAIRKAMAIKQNWVCPLTNHLIIEEDDGNIAILDHNNEPQTGQIDHDEETGFIRGLLCKNTNMLLGGASRFSYGVVISSTILNSDIIANYLHDPPFQKHFGKVVHWKEGDWQRRVANKKWYNYAIKEMNL